MIKQSVHWVIQTNIFAEEGFEALINAIKTFGLPCTLVKVVPFIGDLEPVEGDLPPDGAKAIVMGSYTLAKVAKQRGWVPGAFVENLDFEIQREHWGDRMLNYDAVVTAFDQVSFQRMPFFLRPVHDTKAFTGFVCDWPYYEEWRDSVRLVPETTTLTADTPVMICSKKEIYSETRFWIVAGRVVTQSGYKLGTIKRYTRPEEVDPLLCDFAIETVSVWTPNEAFVLDLAMTAEGPKIVEVNNLNSAGWYKGDLQKLVNALENI